MLHQACYVGVGDPNTGSDASTRSALLSKPPSLLQFQFLKVLFLHIKTLSFLKLRYIFHNSIYLSNFTK